MGILLASDADIVAATEAGQTTGNILIIVAYVAIFAGIYFFLMRPQRKEQKRVAAMQASVEAGDYILTTSGFYGCVIGIEDDVVIVEFGNNKNCRISMEKSAISRVQKPGESAPKSGK